MKMGETARERHREQGTDPRHEQRETEVADVDPDVRCYPRNPRGKAPEYAPVNCEHDRSPAPGAPGISDAYCQARH